MRPAQYDIQVYKGDTFSLPVTIKEDGVVKDLSSATFLSKIIDNDGTALATITVVETDLVNGQITLTMSAATTAGAGLTTGANKWDFQVTEGGVVNTYIAGKAYVIDDVSE